MSRREVRATLAVLGALLCAGLLSETVQPAWAAGDASSGTAEVGDFSLGDGIDGALDESDGSFAVAVPAPIGLRWDSRAVGSNRLGLGHGWTLGLGSISTEGGVRVTPASSGRGSFELDAAHPSGLAGYGTHDVRFEAREGSLPARPGAAEVRFSFVLHELGGRVVYFDDDGDPVAAVEAGQRRSDWVWDPEVPHRLIEAVDGDGVLTRLRWSDEGVRIRPGANVQPREGSGAGGEWVLRFGSNRSIASAESPVGDQIEFEYDDTGRIVGVITATGATTTVDWTTGADGIARATHARVVRGSDGRELSARSWTLADASTGQPTDTGWPRLDEAASAAGGMGHVTEVSDGATTVESTYDSRGLLTQRRILATTPSGEAELQRQALTYPDLPSGEPSQPAQLPGNWSRPTASSVVHADGSGRTRSIADSYTFDEFGRLARHVAADGTAKTTEYDDLVPDGAVLPVGLPVQETTIAPDGAVQRVTHELNHERTGAVVVEHLAGRAGPGEPELTVTERAEYEVGADGVVREERVFPNGDRRAVPIISRFTEQIAVAEGAKTTQRTVAVGTAAEATTSERTSLVHGGVLETVDETGARVSTAYDAVGRPVEAVGPTGTTTTRYESSHRHGRNATIVTTPDGVVNTEVRDELDRVVQLTDNIDDGRAVAGHVRLAESREYPEAGVLRVTDAWGAVTTTRQDVFGREVETTSPTGLALLTRYDDTANTKATGQSVTHSLDDAAMVVTEQRDVAGRTVGTSGVRADGVAMADTAMTLDGSGRIVRTEDGISDITVEHDLRGDPVRTTVAPANEAVPGSPVVAARAFDAFGASREKVLSADGQSRSGGRKAFDELGRVVSTWDQLGRETTTQYTSDGLVARVATWFGQETVHEYEPGTRTLTSTTVTSPSAPTVSTAYEHDRATGLLLAVFDSADRRGTEIRHTYDAFGNRLTTVYPDGASVTHRYDRHGRKVQTTDTAGRTTRFAYDEVGLLIETTQYDGDPDRGAAVVARVGYEHDASGRVTRLHRDNDMITEYTFTAAGEIASETTRRAGAPVSERTYRYDGRGNLIERVDSVTEGPGKPTTTTTAYTYDTTDQLIRSAVSTGSGPDAAIETQTEYRPTVSGEIAAEVITTRPGTADEVVTFRDYEYDQAGALAAVTTDGERVAQVHDEAGNLLVAADGTHHTYDAANRRTGSTPPDGRTIETRYWADGTRRSLSSNGASTTLYWDDSTVLNEVHVRTGREPQTASYLVDAGRHARTTSAGTVYYGTDRHGNVTELVDASGTVVDRYAYSDYGATTAAAPTEETLGDVSRNPFRYAGEWADITGSIHLRAREYDPGTKVFGSRDPAELFTRYAFADLNPIMKVDPTGYAGELDVNTWIVAGLSVVVGAATLVGGVFSAGIVAGIAGGGLIADTLALVSSALILADSFQPDFLDDATVQGLSWAEWALVPGVFGAAVVLTKQAPRFTRWAAKQLGYHRKAPASPEKRMKFLTKEFIANPGAETLSKKLGKLKARMQNYMAHSQAHLDAPAPDVLSRPKPVERDQAAMRLLLDKNFGMMMWELEGGQANFLTHFRNSFDPEYCMLLYNTNQRLLSDFSHARAKTAAATRERILDLLLNRVKTTAY